MLTYDVIPKYFWYESINELNAHLSHMSLLSHPSLCTGSSISATAGSTNETDFLECEVNDQYLRTSGTVTDQI
jgi:hypothetical protein